MNKILLILLLIALPSVVQSAEVYSINTQSNYIKVFSEEIPDSYKKRGKEFRLSTKKVIVEALVLIPVSDERLVLKVKDASLFEIGDNFDFPPEEISSNKVGEEPKIEYGKHFFSPDNYAYELTPLGFRSYMDEELYHSNKALYNRLNVDLHVLQARYSFGKLIAGVGIIAGGIMTSVGSSVLENDEASEQDKDMAREITGQGLLIMLAGGAVGLALIPDKNEVVDLINEHNSKYPEGSIKLGDNTKQNSFKKSSKLAFMALGDYVSLNYTYRF